VTVAAATTPGEFVPNQVPGGWKNRRCTGVACPWLRRQMVSDLARMQTHAVTVPDVVLGDTFDTWFKEWSKSAPHDLIGDTVKDSAPQHYSSL
jgi:hypothetical protein